MSRLSHIDSKGNARMVDVSEKPPAAREAVASGTILMRPETLTLLKENRVAKGDVLQVARVAGIMAAKKTPDIIPLCHSLSITNVSVDFTLDEEQSRVLIESSVKTVGQTGVEMEALTAVAAAALTIYDMCKAVDREMTITGIMLLEKRGGRSGEFRREKD
ncbi:MAG: cyclic pyranopterin monophosphate synthase accessory protein [bacterium]|nr:MAG: cyclic pyranopterin monophosphate synthase accessory protein [bacterium]